jgi:hypothetical protein
MPERRSQERPGSPDRRTFPRPPLWLNLLLLFLAFGGVLLARVHRERIETRFANVIDRQQATPDDLRKLKEELAELDLSREELERELKGRAEFVDSLKSENFYLSIDTRARKLRFYYGDTVLREADVTIGEARTIASGEDKSWTFVPLKGAFKVEAKMVGYDWPVPEWVYADSGQPIPEKRPVVPNGLGRYVIFLGDGYAIHSPPASGSPLSGAKPGSFMVPDDDLRAIWPRIHKDKTQVYIF